ncbi:MAG TPA: hypothetical protein VJL84_02305 [Kiloniellales bacterium]|nr:hypothetical protein [Kiloniellales bacterium]
MPWSLPEDPAALLALGRDYPYAAPAQSYLFRDGEVSTPDADGWTKVDFAGRTAVVAHGSNRSPAQLARKFMDRAYHGDTSVPVVYGWLAGYDVVYAAHVARYGAVTSTLYHAPGVRSRIAVTWLAHEQLAYMHQTERMNYSYGRLPPGSFSPEVGPAPRSLYAYVGNHGPFLLDGRPTALAAVEAENRPWPARRQDEMQDFLAKLFHPGEAWEELILLRIAQPEQRRSFETRLRSTSAPAALAGFELLERLDGEAAG